MKIKLFKSKTLENTRADHVRLIKDELIRALDVEWWRWRHLYLRAKTLQILQRATPDADHQRTIDSLLADISDEDRAVYERYYQARLTMEIQSANRNAQDVPADPDAVEVELIESLERAADGRDNPQGLGTVPSSDGETFIIPPETDPRALVAKRRGVSYSAGSGSKEKAVMTSAQKMLSIVVLVLCIGSLVWCVGSIMAFGQKEDPTPVAQHEGTTTPESIKGSTPTPIADVNGNGGKEITVAYPQTLEIAQKDSSAPRVYRVFASANELGGAWKPETPQGTAAWLNGTYVNHIFCLPAGDVGLLAQMQRGDAIIMRPASGAVRHYEIVRTRTVGRQQIEIMDQRRAGLTLIACGGSANGNANDRMIAEAVYTPETVQTVALKVGDIAELPGLARIVIQSARSLVPTGETTGYTTVEIEAIVENLSASTLNERDIADRLIIAGNIAERLTPANASVAPEQKRAVTYRYLVPIAGGPASWQATSATGESIQIALTLDAAAGQARTAYSIAMNPGDLRISYQGKSDVLILIPITITPNRSSVELRADDLSLWVGNRSVALIPQNTSLPMTIKGPTTLTLAAHIPDVSQFELQVGEQRWKVTLP